MGRVLLYNDNVHPFSDELDGKRFTIAPGAFEEMEEHEAVRLRGKFSPPVKDAQKRDRPEHFRILRMVPKESVTPKAEAQKFVCQFDGKEFGTQKQLDDYIAENHVEKIADDDSRDEFKEKRTGKQKKDS